MQNILLFILALVPILALLLALGVFQWPAHFVTPAIALLTLVLGLVFWRTDLLILGGAALEGGMIALWPIMIVIVAAIFTYNVAVKTGALNTIENFLSGITRDKRLQVLILAWGLGGFLESVAGYGTAVAIPASILIVLGFNPLFASVLSLIANTVPTAFGAVGIPVSTLSQLTGLDPFALSGAVALQLTPFIILIPFVLVILAGKGFHALKGVWHIALAAGISFAVPHWFAANFLGPELPALIGSSVSLLVTVLLSNNHGKEEKASQAESVRLTGGKIFLAWLPYLLMFIFIILASPLFPWIQHALKTINTSLTFVPGGKPVTFYWIATPGVLIILAAVIAGKIQGATFLELIKQMRLTFIKLGPSFLTVISILTMAKMMSYSGMIGDIALVIASATGLYFPLISPFLGALGTFVTGSDTSSNILFGQLQTEVAGKIGQNPVWLAAANTAGATAGKMISPQSIAVAVGATGQAGQEGSILRQTLPACLTYVALLGVFVFFFRF